VLEPLRRDSILKDEMLLAANKNLDRLKRNLKVVKAVLRTPRMYEKYRKA